MLDRPSHSQASFPLQSGGSRRCRISGCMRTSSQVRNAVMSQNMRHHPGSVLLEPSHEFSQKISESSTFLATPHRPVPRGAGAADGASDAEFGRQPVRRYEIYEILPHDSRMRRRPDSVLPPQNFTSCFFLSPFSSITPKCGLL